MSGAMSLSAHLRIYRFRHGQLPSCLDYVFTDEDNLVHDLQYRTPVGKSDHVVLTWNIIVHAEELKCCFKKYNYWKGDYSAIAKHLGNVDWSEVLPGKTVDDMWNYLKELLTSLMDDYIPLKSDKFRKKKGHWLKSATIKMIKKRDAGLEEIYTVQINSEFRSL